MLLFIPIRTDSPVRRQPIVNYGLIAANVLTFLILDGDKKKRGRLAALAYEAERRMQSLREEIDRSRIELARIRKDAPSFLNSKGGE